MKSYTAEAHFVTRETLPETIQSVASQQKQSVYYVSGPPAFVEATAATLKKQGVRSIKTDGFLGY